MAQEQLEEGTKEERLKAALWYSIGNMVDSITIEQNVNTTPQFIGGLSEMLWSQIEAVSKDAEAFAKHAGRETVRAEDIILLARRNESLKTILRKSKDTLKQKDGTG